MMIRRYMVAKSLVGSTKGRSWVQKAHRTPWRFWLRSQAIARAKVESHMGARGEIFEVIDVKTAEIIFKVETE